MAARVWVAQPVSGAIVSAASAPQIRLTVSSTTGMTTGDVRTVFGVGGTTEANGTWTITVIDGTHIDLQGTTFSNLYTSGGAVNGKWDATNTNNWVTTSGGTNYGQTVPGSGDTVVLDGSSGGGTVTVNTTVTVQSITCGAFTGTFDFSANNNNVTLSATTAFSGTGTGTRTINLGNGIWTLTSTSAVSISPWNMSTTTNLTFNANSSTIIYSGVTAGNRNFVGGGLTYNTLTINANSSGGSITIGGASTFGTLNIAAPNAIGFPISLTTTISNAFTFTGSSGSQILVSSATLGTTGTVSVASGTPTMTWAGVRDLAFTGGATFSATNSFDLGHNSGITIAAPSASGGSGGISRSRAFGGFS